MKLLTIFAITVTALSLSFEDEFTFEPNKQDPDVARLENQEGFVKTEPQDSALLLPPSPYDGKGQLNEKLESLNDSARTKALVPEKILSEKAISNQKSQIIKLEQPKKILMPQSPDLLDATVADTKSGSLPERLDQNPYNFIEFKTISKEKLAPAKVSKWDIQPEVRTRQEGFTSYPLNESFAECGSPAQFIINFRKRVREALHPSGSTVIALIYAAHRSQLHESKEIKDFKFIFKIHVADSQVYYYAVQTNRLASAQAEDKFMFTNSLEDIKKAFDIKHIEERAVYQISGSFNEEMAKHWPFDEGAKPPQGSKETTSSFPASLNSLVIKAFDDSQSQLKQLLLNKLPDIKAQDLTFGQRSPASANKKVIHIGAINDVDYY